MQPDGEAQLLAFNKNGETPLKLALSYGHLTVCDLLFEACNDPSRPELASDGDIGCLGASMHGVRALWSPSALIYFLPF
jgi:ankyrin repeat protein